MPLNFNEMHNHRFTDKLDWKKSPNQNLLKIKPNFYFLVFSFDYQSSKITDDHFG